MFNQFVAPRSSSCVEGIAVDVFAGVVDVLYHSGENYRYENVSRRAILNLMLNKNISFGLWVNDVLLGCDSNAICYA